MSDQRENDASDSVEDVAKESEEGQSACAEIEVGHLHPRHNTTIETKQHG